MALSPSSGFMYYLALVEAHQYTDLFKSAQNINYLNAISEEKSKHRYEPDKWSIKQIVGHMTDHERIMIYRALRFSRKDTTPQPGYDQDLLVTNSRFDDIPFSDLLQDFKNVRAATLTFIAQLSEEQLQFKGIASNFEMSVEDILKAAIGHEIHHIKILHERY